MPSCDLTLADLTVTLLRYVIPRVTMINLSPTLLVSVAARSMNDHASDTPVASCATPSVLLDTDGSLPCEIWS